MSGFSTALGILYAEDFSHERTASKPMPRPPAAPPPGPTQADVDAACIRAVQAAQTAWSGSADERRAEALAAIAAAITEAREYDASQTELLAQAMARTVLAMLAGVMPHLCRNHGDDEVRAAVARFVPILARSTRVVVRVHPDLIGVLADDIAAIDDSVAGNVELRPANLPSGDVRVDWEDGGMARDTAAICSAMQDTLAQLGLDAAPSETTHTGSLALAQ